MVHRISLASQTARTFSRLLDIPVTEIRGGKKRVPKNGILVTTVQTATNLLDNSKFKKFLEGCDVLFIDELHTNKAASCAKIVKMCGAPMRFGLSGTIARKNKAKMLHYRGMTGPVIAEVRNEELVNLGRSARPIARFVEVRTDKIPKKLGYSKAYRKGIVKNSYRNALVVGEVIHHLERDRKILVTVARIRHGLRLQEILKTRTDLRVEFLSGSTPVYVRNKIISRFQSNRVSVIIASPIFDTGVDIPGGVDAWVNAAGGIGWELVLQRLGRVLRRKEGENKVYISDFVDFHNSYLMKHSLARIRHYQNEKIVEIKFVEGIDGKRRNDERADDEA